MADHARDSTFADLDMAMPWLHFSKWLRPIPLPLTMRRVRVLSCDPTGSGRGSDHAFVTVDDVSSLLNCSGCRMSVLGSTPEG